MVTPGKPPRQGTLQDLIQGLLDRGYGRIVQPTLERIARSTNSGLIERRLKELKAEAARLAAEGQKLTPDNVVFRAFIADLDVAMRENARRVGNVAEAVQGSGINAAGRIQRQMALPGVTDQQLARMGLRWNTPDPEAVARLVNYAESEAWANMLAQYGDDVGRIISEQAIRGIAAGWNPLRTAERVLQLTETLPSYQANNLLRTLQITSYRDSTAIHQQANIAIASQIIRIAARDLRTCLSCIAQHGDVIWDSERDVTAPILRVNDHHSGRCSSVMIVKGRSANIQSGSDWFNNLTPERQAQQRSFVNNRSKLEAYRAGRVTLRDFVEPYSDPVFGPMIREASLKGVLGEDARQFLRRP